MSTASNTSCPFVLFLPYFFKSCLFSSRQLKLHYLQNAFPQFTQHTLQVFSICKQQIYSLSEYIPRKRTECICCTYMVKCKIYKSHVIDYYPMFTSTSSSGSAFTRQRPQPVAIMRADHYETSQMQINLRVKCLSFFSDFNHNRHVSSNFINIPNMKFHDTQSSGSRAVVCEQTDGRTLHS